MVFSDREFFSYVRFAISIVTEGVAAFFFRCIDEDLTKSHEVDGLVNHQCFIANLIIQIVRNSIKFHTSRILQWNNTSYVPTAKPTINRETQHIHMETTC